MNEKQRKLLEEFRKMPTDELEQYQSATSTANRLVNILGVASVFVIIWNLSLLAVIIGSPIVFVIANLGSSLSDSLREMRAILAKR